MFVKKRRTEERKETTEEIPASHDDNNNQSSDKNEEDNNEDKKKIENDDEYEKSNSSDDDQNNKYSDEYDENNEEEENYYNEEEDNNDDENNEEEDDSNREVNDDDDDDNEEENNNSETDDDKTANDDNDNSDESNDSKHHKNHHKSYNSKHKSDNHHSDNKKISSNVQYSKKYSSKHYKDHKSGSSSFKPTKSYNSSSNHHSKPYNSNMHTSGTSYKDTSSNYKSSSPKSSNNKNYTKLSAPSSNYSKHSSNTSKGTKVVYIYKKVYIKDDGSHSNNYDHSNNGNHSSNSGYKKNSYSGSNYQNNYGHHHHRSHYKKKLDPYSNLYGNIDCTSDFKIDKTTEEGRSSIASQTCAIIQSGSYQVERKNGTYETIDISKQIKDSVDGTRVYKPDFFVTRDPTQKLTPHKICKIELVQTSSFGSARKILKEDETKRVCILNFASATKPGGGFIEGKKAQEEALSRQSALYASLYNVPEMYEKHRKNVNHYYYSDYMIYSPDVPVFRDDIKERLLPGKEMFTASVITSAAPYLKKVKINAPNFESKYRNDYEKIILDRIRKIILLAIYKKTDALVLGAYGCGVFDNDKDVIFGSFKTVLIDEGYGKYLDLVTFPIVNPSSGNGRAFKKAFKDHLS